MDCLVSQQRTPCNGQGVGTAGDVSVNIGTEISSFIQANPLPSIGIGVALIVLIYQLLKSK